MKHYIAITLILITALFPAGALAQDGSTTSTTTGEAIYLPLHETVCLHAHTVYEQDYINQLYSRYSADAEITLSDGSTLITRAYRGCIYTGRLCTVDDPCDLNVRMTRYFVVPQVTFLCFLGSLEGYTGDNAPVLMVDSQNQNCYDENWP